MLPPRADGATRGVEDAHFVVVHPARVQAARHVHESRADYVPVVDERREAVCDVAVLLRARLAVLEVVLLRDRYAGVPVAQLWQRLDGRTQWSRRRCRRLARAIQAVASPSTRGGGWAPSGPASPPWECRAAQGRRARSKEGQRLNRALPSGAFGHAPVRSSACSVGGFA
eukprot:scaffold71803_cov73-Phaeocystis_antarctica.AAC.1